MSYLVIYMAFKSTFGVFLGYKAEFLPAPGATQLIIGVKYTNLDWRNALHKLGCQFLCSDTGNSTHDGGYFNELRWVVLEIWSNL